MNKHFVENKRYRYHLEDMLINKVKISFIGALGILEESGYGVDGQEFLTSSKYQINTFSEDKIDGVERADLILVAASNSIERDTVLLQTCRKKTEKAIIVLGPDDEDYAANMLYAGADDYLKLPCSKQVLDTVLYVHMRREFR